MALSSSLMAILLASCNMSVLDAGLITNLVAPIWHAIEDRLDLEYDETRALDAKSEQFWQPVLQAATEGKPGQHADIYKDSQAVLADLPEETYSYVHKALLEAVSHLHHADDALMQQNSASLHLAADKLASPAGGQEEGLSFLTGSHRFLSLAMLATQHLFGLSYKERLHKQVKQRQAEILPSLRGASKVTGDVLAETREASNKAFDVLKYDLYHRGSPKTPEAAKQVAQKIIAGARETRHRFFQPIMSSVDGMARDVSGEEQFPSATVDAAIAEGMGTQSEEAEHQDHRGTLEA
eukprot:TRINITY_DN34790_c0_g1_i1.p1 TRINITY_DN34790_c0_g1~~TRINITY_DN34790_c0_g1_i1.p1  ORF type:complete len:295 (+),score=72.94 TRINITY_DN34790_c0_g1_i1:52-936(+)